MRLLLADHDTTDRRVLRELLERYGIVVAGEASDGLGVIGLARELKPDLTLIELAIPGIRADEAVQAIVDADPDARVVLLAGSPADDERELLDGLLAGACGYLFKDAPAAETIAGIRVAIEGDTTVSPAIVTSLIGRLREQRRREREQSLPKPPPLTRRERDVLRLLVAGHSDKEIAAALFIGMRTVQTHAEHLYAKLGVRNRHEATAVAVRRGLV